MLHFQNFLDIRLLATSGFKIFRQRAKPLFFLTRRLTDIYTTEKMVLPLLIDRRLIDRQLIDRQLIDFHKKTIDRPTIDRPRQLIDQQLIDQRLIDHYN
jgi:hypothetical protein